ncbi:Uncharacterised protein [Vibrio cholerae]|nr:Uncharacterised protein [Vibrio cholerae]
MTVIVKIRLRRLEPSNKVAGKKASPKSQQDRNPFQCVHHIVFRSCVSGEDVSMLSIRFEIEY